MLDRSKDSESRRVTGLRLEIAANGLGSALAAQDGGADRVELCADLAVGGTTPSAGTIAAARAALKIDLHVLIRPRAGDFLYSPAEREAMLRDVEYCARVGCDGVVIGVLDTLGKIDIAACQELIAAAGRLAVTFHRAFDVVRDPSEALDTIIRLGCSRVLTSGGCTSAREGAPMIAGLVQRAAGRIVVMAGGGIQPPHVAELVRTTGVREVHASAAAMRASATQQHTRSVKGLDGHWMQTDPERVRELAAALRSVERPAE